MTSVQANRHLSVTIKRSSDGRPLDEDFLLLDGFWGQEGISRLFSFDLDLLSERPERVSFREIVGGNVTITLLLPDGTPRYFNGFISRFSQGGRDARYTHYQAEVVPWLWFLIRTANCRIFQNKNVKEILKIIFDETIRKLRGAGCAYDDLQVQGNFENRDYCTQYQETDYEFVSRLMEEEGIYYFFKHEHGQHTLVLANTPSAHNLYSVQKMARFWLSGGGVEDRDLVTAWNVSQEIRSGKFSLRDYHFEMPQKRLLASVNTAIPVGSNENYEIYHYPGGYAEWFIGRGQDGCERCKLARIEARNGEPGEANRVVKLPMEEEANRVVKLRMEEEETPAIVVNGASTCRVFTPGYLFHLEVDPGDYADPDQIYENMEGTYLLTSVHHIAAGGSYPGREGFRYSNNFSCIPHDVRFVRDTLNVRQPIPYRPPRITPKPTVKGPQTAVVVGKADEEIWTDKYGRVKVQFHWDREGQYNENSSCWVRVSQNWAGKRWGAMFIPRIGQEVIVDFLEGDPDQPIITGRVYNADQMPPYDLPANQTQSGIKSRSSRGGTPANFNEIRFEDKKGQEQLYIHAERNLSTVVEADESRSVGHDRSTTIGNDENINIDRHRTMHIHNGHETIVVHTGNHTMDVNTGHHTVNVKTGNQELNVNTGHSTLNVRTGNRDVNVPAGAYQLTANRVVITATTDLTIQCGAGKININATGIITITSPMVKINC